MKDAGSTFFNALMRILDNAEGTRDTTYGPFSFLWDNSYVKRPLRCMRFFILSCCRRKWVVGLHT